MGATNSLCSADNATICRWQTSTFALITAYDADNATRVVHLSHVCKAWRQVIVASDTPVLVIMWHDLVKHSAPALLKRMSSNIVRLSPQASPAISPSAPAPSSSSSNEFSNFSGRRRSSAVEQQQQQQPATLVLEQLVRVPSSSSPCATRHKHLQVPGVADAENASLSNNTSRNATPRSDFGGGSSGALSPTTASSPPAVAAAGFSSTSVSSLLDVEQSSETEVVKSGLQVGEELVRFSAAGGPLWAIEHLVFKGGRRFNREKIPSFLNYKSIKSGNPALVAACKAGRLGVVPTLLTGGVGVNRHGAHKTTALLEAIKRNDDALVKYLLDHGAEPLSGDAVDATPLVEAVKADPTGRILGLLLASGKFESNYVRPAARSKSPQAASAAENRRDDEDQATTPTTTTTTTGGATVSAAQMLEEKLRGLAAPGPPLDIKSTALLAAVTRGYIAPVELLIKAGANCNAAEKSTSLTPLHIAIKSAHNHAIAIVDLLLAGGADVDAMSSAHYTPLMQAAVVGDVVVAKRLIAERAKLNVRDLTGASAMVLAKRHDNERIVELLRSHDVLE